MEKYKIPEDIEVFYVTATSFPDGILPAHQKLHEMLSSVEGRNSYGISAPGKDGVIIYKAAVEATYPGEGETLGCKTFIITKGEYISILLRDYQKDVQSISRAFKELIADDRIDPQGACVEMYLGEKDVRCMVRLAPHKT
jgi:hypothetical protein